MNGLLDILLAAPKNVSGEWIRLLIPIIIVIAYAVSGILKMRSKLDKEQPTEEQQKPRYKPLDGQSRNWERPDAEPAVPEMSPGQRRQVDRQIERKLVPEPAAPRQPAPARPQQRRTLEAFLETIPPKPPIAAAPQPAAAPARQERLLAQAARRQQTARKIKPKAPPPKAKVAAKEKATAQPSPISSLTERLAQPDEIRRAIIYAEILGKPIALRDI